MFMTKDYTRMMIEMMTVDFENSGRVVTILPSKKTRKSSSKITISRDELRREVWGKSGVVR